MERIHGPFGNITVVTYLFRAAKFGVQFVILIHSCHYN